MKNKKSDEPKLVGWDDGKIYFYDKNSVEYCVTDEKVLFKKIIKECEKYFYNKSKR